MNKPLLSLLAATAMLVSIPALAQQKAPATAPPATPAVKPVVIPRGVFVTGQTPGQWLAKDRLLGAKVLNKEGAIIGDIEDLIVNPVTNQISGVIMGAGGFLGVGEKKIGVSLAALVQTTKDGKTVLTLPSATKEVLAAVPAFQRAEPKKSLIDRTKEKAKELTDKTKETAKDAAAAVKEKAGPALEKAKEATSKAVEKAKEAVTPAPATTPAPTTK